jgi:hypothetical protein
MNDFKAQDPQEGREVRVADPDLSADADQRLTEEEGIRNPEQHFSDLVDEFTAPNSSRR